MRSLIVGSAAMKHWFPDFKDPKDIDVFSSDDRSVLVKELSKNFTNSEKRLELFWDEDLAACIGEHDTCQYASPDQLYTLKVSHAFWDIQWEKHMHDIMFLKENGARFIPELYEQLYKVWVRKHGKKQANLNVPANQFFKTTVTRVYEHDSIHASVAYYERPLFEKILRDGSEVAVDRSKFDSLSLEDKCKLVREEIYATALERLIIPNNYRYSQKAAYAWAIKKTVTSFSKGWFPLFIVLNFEQLKSPDVDYVARHLKNKDRLILLEKST